jgi:hypothetical protein
MSKGGLDIQATSEQVEVLDNSVNLIWASPPPEPGSLGRMLLEALQSAQILDEPFDRAMAGLDEAYK